MTSRSFWLSTLRCNWLVPVLIALLIPLAHFVENPNRLDAYWARIVMLIGINIILAVSLQLINGVSGQFSLGHAGFMAVGAFIAGYATKTYGVSFNDDGDLVAAKPLGVAVYFVSLTLVLLIAGAVLYGLFSLMRQSRRIHSSLPGILMMLVVAWVVIDLGRLVPGLPPVWGPAIAMLLRLFDWTMRLGLNAISHLHVLPLGFGRPLLLLMALIGGGLAASVAGLIIGLPTLRLRGDYLAIATLGFSEIIRVAIVNSEALGGATGLTNIPVYAVQADPSLGIRGVYIFPWIYGAAIITAIIIWRIANSAKGRALQAVREDEIAAAAIGIDTTHHKVLAFVIGAFFAGVAGAMYAHYDGYVNPNSFQIMRSIEIVVMVTLGGLGSVSGAILAAIVLTILPEVLRSIAEWRMVIYSLLLIVMMLVRPEGLLGRRELWPRRKSRSTARGFEIIHGAT